MRVAFYLNVISPHQLPFAREVVRIVGEENFRYVYAEDLHTNRKAMGWDDGDVPAWCTKSDENAQELIDADFVYTGIRCVGLMARRSSLGKKTAYYSERWFKPRFGILRMLSQPYRRMAKEFVRLMDEGLVIYLPMGIHAARDMARLCGLMHGDLKCLFCAPELEFERKPGGKIRVSVGVKDCRSVGVAKKYCLDKMRMWGYFVESGERGIGNGEQKENDKRLRVLWVGRLLKLKCVDTIIRAVGKLSTCSSCSAWLKISLDIYGTGPEEMRLKKLAAKYGDTIKFYPSVPIASVRALMREHDVYVLTSNAYEGWGAVVSEALEEGMSVLGTFEAGSSATILPKERLFHSGDYKALSVLLEKECKNELPPSSIGEWTAGKSAEQLSELC